MPASSDEMIRQQSLHEIKYIVWLSLTEIGLGSLMHAFGIPGGGHFLSLNQGLLLTQFALEEIRSEVPADRRRVAQGVTQISLSGGLLKSLSPAGKKLTPMLAIAVQGMLYAVGVGIGGANRLGLLFGAVLASVWGFLQPLVLARLLVGGDFFAALENLWRKTLGSFGIAVEWGLGAFVALIVVKIILAAATVLFADRFGRRWKESLGAQGRTVLRQRQSAPAGQPPAVAALRDLLSPVFLFSLLLSLSFAYFNDSSRVALIWALLRPVALAYLIYYLLRAVSPQKFYGWVKRWNPALAERIGRAQEALHEEI